MITSHSDIVYRMDVDINNMFLVKIKLVLMDILPLLDSAEVRVLDDTANSALILHYHYALLCRGA